MKEPSFQPESAPQPEPKESAESLRDMAVDAYKPFVEQGSPESLDSKDPEVAKANELYYRWQEALDAKAEGDREAEHRANFAKTMFYVKAGFSDPEYLKNVLGFLDSDLQDAEEGGDKPLTAVAEEIKAAMELIQGRLDKLPNP